MKNAEGLVSLCAQLRVSVPQQRSIISAEHRPAEGPEYVSGILQPWKIFSPIDKSVKRR